MSLDLDTLYPAPPDAPRAPEPPAGYRGAVARVVGALALFAVGYASVLTLALALLAYAASWWWVLSASNPAIGLLLAPVVLICAAPALAALSAWFVARAPRDPALVALTREDQPTLHAFLDRLCDEVGAPRPARVWADHKVNASVFFRASFWTRTPRDLIIGLGLVDALGLSEFKAVLAHELGHFAQRSIALTGLVHRARLLSESVSRGGALAGALERAARWPAPLSAPPGLALALTRLAGAPLVISWATVGATYARLSRLMELAADDVAVHAAGATGLVHAIVRLDFADRCMLALRDDLEHAGEHGLRTDDLFAHTTPTADALRRRLGDPGLGVPAADLTRQRGRRAWAEGSHPSDAARAQRARSLGIDADPDARPAWSLFARADALRRLVTRRALPGADPDDARRVEDFLALERDARHVDPRYRDLYRGRPFAVADLDALTRDARALSHDPDALRARLLTLYGDDFAAHMDAHEVVVEDLRAIGDALSAGAEELVHAGARLNREDAIERVAELQRQLVAHHQWVVAHDRRVQLAHAAAASALGEVALEDLLSRYRAQRGVQQVRELLAVAHAALRRGGELTAPHARLGLARALELADEVALPRLEHVDRGATLGDMLRARLERARDADLDLEATLSALSRRVARVDTKNLSTLIRAHEEIACTWELAFDPSRHASPS